MHDRNSGLRWKNAAILTDSVRVKKEKESKASPLLHSPVFLYSSIFLSFVWWNRIYEHKTLWETKLLSISAIFGNYCCVLFGFHHPFQSPSTLHSIHRNFREFTCTLHNLNSFLHIYFHHKWPNNRTLSLDKYVLFFWFTSTSTIQRECVSHCLFIWRSVILLV